MDKRPIGMFDSGFGGLTVARAAIDLLPAEDLVYLGDTGRYPYGSRDLAQVLQFSREIAAFLLDEYDIKFLVIACNTATAAALTELEAELAIPVLGVIDPGVKAVGQATESGRVGVIGTVGTIAPRAYEQAALRWAPDLSLTTCACPGFVEFVERGETSGLEIEILADRLLAPITAAGIDTLLLGCTHYPFLARVISDVVGPSVTLISSADETAFALASQLQALGLNHPDEHRQGTHQFISSGDVRAFAPLGSKLLGPELVDARRWHTDPS
ncbi:MAG: glutamate racemase [Acidimicrobiales bacterium]